MYSKTASLAFLGMAVFSSLTSAQTIAFGQEIQNDDQTNHWTVWIDKTDYPCDVEQVLGVITKVPCGQTFNLGEVEYSFSACTGPSIDDAAAGPTVILDAAGNQIGACGTSKDYVSCNNDNHDVVKHGVCQIVNTAAVEAVVISNGTRVHARQF
ncbi:hypothetical protein F4777DRAFT_582647 [Nemania sp. FL0916]|nr:hypothetical protein F4777DRAFT_582647 [Nemania sp. FL0916]